MNIEKTIRYFKEQFPNLSDQDISEVLSFTKIITLKKEDYFIRNGEYKPVIALVISGIIRGVYYTDSGQEMTPFFWAEHQAVASWETIYLQQASALDFEAIEPTTLAVIDFIEFKKLTGSHPEHNYTIPYYVSFVESFTNALGVDSFHLAGNSLGGEIAWEYAIDYPHKLGKLILLDPAGMKGEKDKKNIFDLIQQYDFISKPLKNLGTSFLVKNGMKQSYYEDEKITDEKYQYYKTAILREGNRTAFFERMKVKDQPRLDLLGQIATPTLILWGDQDALIPVAYAKAFNEAIPNSNLIIYPNVGHIPMEEIPDISVKDVINFLEE